MGGSTDNKVQAIREQKFNTSGVVSLPFTFRASDSNLTIRGGSTIIVNTGITAKGDISAEPEISQEDKKRFYKATLRSKIL